MGSRTMLSCTFVIVMMIIPLISRGQFLHGDTYVPPNDPSCTRVVLEQQKDSEQLKSEEPVVAAAAAAAAGDCKCKSPVYWSKNAPTTPPLKSCCEKAALPSGTQFFYKPCLPTGSEMEPQPRYIGPGHGHTSEELKNALSNRQVVIIGDSLSRQWYESLPCYLGIDWTGWQSIKDRSSIDIAQMIGIPHAKYRHNNGFFAHSSFEISSYRNSNNNNNNNSSISISSTASNSTRSSKGSTLRVEPTGKVSFFSSNPIIEAAIRATRKGEGWQQVHERTHSLLDRLITEILSNSKKNIAPGSSTRSTGGSGSSSNSSRNVRSSWNGNEYSTTGSQVVPLILLAGMHGVATYKLASTCRRQEANCVFMEYLPHHFASEFGFNISSIDQPCENDGTNHWCNRRGHNIELWENTKGFLKIPVFDAFISRVGIHINSISEEQGAAKRTPGAHMDCRHMYSDTAIFEPIHLGLLQALFGVQLSSSFGIYG